MNFMFNLINSSIIFMTWILASIKMVSIFCTIVMVRICTPRFGLGGVTRLAWGSLFTYLVLFFIIYIVGVLWL